MVVCSVVALRRLLLGSSFRMSNKISNTTQKTVRTYAIMMTTQQQKLIVRNAPDDEYIRIVMEIGGKERNMDRLKTEPLEKTFGRIKVNATPKPDKKKLKKAKKEQQQNSQQNSSNNNNNNNNNFNENNDNGENFNIALYPNEKCIQGEEISTQILNQDAWIQGRVLIVENVMYKIDFNPPTIQKIYKIGAAMIGYPILPRIDYLFCENSEFKWQWFKNNQLICSNARYVPVEADLNEMIVVKVSAGEGCAEMTLGPIENPPNRPHLKKIKQQINSQINQNEIQGQNEIMSLNQEKNQDSISTQFKIENKNNLIQNLNSNNIIRIMSYNVLADQYLQTEMAKSLFAHCDKKILDQDRRCSMVLEDILNYNSDLICLQEVDEKAFEQFYQPQLQYIGFTGHYTKKRGTVREGSAFFFRNQLFNLITVKDLVLAECFKIPLQKQHEQFKPMLDASPNLQHALEKLGTIAQIVLLERKNFSNHNKMTEIINKNEFSSEKISSSQQNNLIINRDSQNNDNLIQQICVINTHLFFQHTAPHIRTIHTAAILEEAEILIQQNGGNLEKTGLLFCGDLNSGVSGGTPGVLQLLNDGKISGNFWDWAEGANFSWGALEKQENQTQNNQNSENQQIQSEIQNQQDLNSDVQQMDIDSSIPQTQKINQQSLDQNLSLADADEMDIDFSSIEVKGIDIEIPYKFRSSDDFKSPFSNFVPGYVGLLDYVWYTVQHFRTYQNVLQYTYEDIQKFLPNERFPSDHTPVVYDLELIPTHTYNNININNNNNNDTYIQQQQYFNGDQNCNALNVFCAESEFIETAMGRLWGGGSIALPSDTVYGLACCAGNEKGINSIYQIKGRDYIVPLAVCVGSIEEISQFADTTQLPPGLLTKLLPGPATVILPLLESRGNLTEGLNPGLKNIGIRVFKDGFLGDLCAKYRKPLALTSANVSGQKSSLEIKEFENLWIRLGAVFDGGRLPNTRTGSTVLDLTQKNLYKIIRQGDQCQEIEEILLQYGYSKYQ